MRRRDLVVVGASAGGVEALSRLVAGLPADLPATVLVVLHIPPGASALGLILDRHGVLPARSAADGDLLHPGQVLVAPPDRQLVVHDGRVLLSKGPRENGHRPSIDVLFRSAAVERGEGVVAVVLSGSDSDGTVGCDAVRARGGLVLVQDIDDALHPTMPASVVQRVGIDGAAPAPEMGALIARACTGDLPSIRPAGGTADPPAPSANGAALPAARTVALLEGESEVGRDVTEAVLTGRRGMSTSGFSCPDCGGVLYVMDQAPLLRYRCRVGHAWSADRLATQQDQAIETALWTAIRTLEEKAELSARLADRAAVEGRPVSSRHFRTAADESGSSAALIKQLLDTLPGLLPGDRQP